MKKADWIAAALIIAFAFLIRSATFGNPTLEPDESFYLLVGIKMHDGLLPYVDIYDRKPFGLFVIYYLVTFISHDPAGYQVLATLFASATGVVIYAFDQQRRHRRWLPLYCRPIAGIWQWWTGAGFLQSFCGNRGLACFQEQIHRLGDVLVRSGYHHQTQCDF